MKHDARQMASLRAVATHLQRKDAGDPFDMLTKKFGDMTDATIKRIGETDAKLGELGSQVGGVQEQLNGLEQKMARGGGFGGSALPTPSWGQQFVKDRGAVIAEAMNDRSMRVQLQVKALTNTPGSVGDLEPPERDPRHALLPKRRLTIRNLLPVISTSSGSISYVEQTSRPSAASTVTEGAQKPESDMTLALRSVNATVIAHWLKVSRQALEDQSQLQDLIDQELRYGLALAEEVQILHGDGVGANLFGLIPNATAYSDLLGLGPGTMIDMIGQAILQAALADFPPDGIVIHPADWMRMRLLKDGDGKYLLGPPMSQVNPQLFGLPVVPTQAMTVDKFLVGNFAEAATLYDRLQPRVELGYVNDDFTRNLATVLAEERVALAVRQPAALVYGDFGLVA